MSKSKPKSIRFDTLVQESGQPEVAALWASPEKDPEFSRWIKTNRVVTLCQQNVGTRKDFGFVGFSLEKNASYLIFPKKIHAEPDTKVVGIKYAKLAEAKPRGSVVKVRPPRRVPSSRAEQADRTAKAKNHFANRKLEERQKPQLRFEAKVLLVAKQNVALEIDAASPGQAKKIVKAKAPSLQIDLQSARTTTRVISLARKKIFKGSLRASGSNDA